MSSGDSKKARVLALARLAIRDYSTHELEAYLTHRGIDPEAASEVVAQLHAERLLDDQRFMRNLTRTQVLRHKGPGYIHSKLSQKGIHVELSQVREMCEESTDGGELELARQLVERRYPKALTDPREQRRAYAALLRRGFSTETARQCAYPRGGAPEDSEIAL